MISTVASTICLFLSACLSFFLFLIMQSVISHTVSVPMEKTRWPGTETTANSQGSELGGRFSSSSPETVAPAASFTATSRKALDQNHPS